ncbi:hypothetical protein ACJX0J_011886, partial [Zea mays]
SSMCFGLLFFLFELEISFRTQPHGVPVFAFHPDEGLTGGGAFHHTSFLGMTLLFHFLDSKARSDEEKLFGVGRSQDYDIGGAKQFIKYYKVKILRILIYVLHRE